MSSCYFAHCVHAYTASSLLRITLPLFAALVRLPAPRQESAKRRGTFGYCDRAHVAFELLGTTSGAVFVENSFSGSCSHFSQLSIIGLFNSLDYILRALGHQYFFTHFENSVQARPQVGDDRTTAAGSLEQAHRWGVSPLNHPLTRQIECEP